MASDDSLCSVLSLRDVKSINTYSSAVHNRFRANHDTYNLRYGAFYRIKSTILRFKKESLEKSVQIHVEKLANIVDRYNKRIQLNILSSGLSSADREYLLPLISQRLKILDFKKEILEIHCCNTVSVHELLLEIGDALIRKCVVRQCRSYVTNEFLSDSKKLFDMLRDAPMYVIRLLLGEHEREKNRISTSVDSKPTVLILILKHIRRISSTVLGDLVSRLSSANLSASIVAVVDDLSPLPLPTDRTAMSALDVSIQLLPGSRGVLDELLGRIYTSGEVPVLFPRVIIEAVREACDCFNLCITSTIDKLILCVGIHFQRRRSILTLCGRSDWLEELGLCGFKRLGSDVTAATSHALSRLLPFIGASDLEGAASGIVLTREGDRAKGGGEAKSVLTQNTTLFRKYFDRLTFDKLVYDCLKLCRDELINEVSRGMLPADLLWSALISGAERYKIGASSKILGEMLRTVKVGLPIMDLTTVQRTVNKLCELVQMALELRASVVSEGDVAAVQYLERLGDIHDVKHALDAISALPSLGVAVRVDALQAQVAYLAPPSRPSSDDQENSADSVNVSTSEELLMMQRQQVKGRESSEGHEAESLSAADMFSFAKDDLLQWLSVAAEHHCRMPELSPVAAIFRLDDSELQTLVACSDTNLQMMFATALEDPSRFFQATKNAHNSFVRFDSTDLYDKFRDLRGQVVANEWIYGLSLFGEQWKQEAGAKPSTVAIRSDSSDGPPSKKSRVVVSASIEQNDGDCLDEENDDEEDAVHMQYSAEMRCRFAFALNDMDRAGLLRCKRAARHELVTVTREMHTWLGGGDSIDM